MREGCPRYSTGWSPGGLDASIRREIRSSRLLLPYYRESFHRRARSTVVHLPAASLLGPEFSMVVSRFPLQPEEELLLIGAEAALNHCILIGRTLVNVEVLQSHLLTLSMEALLELYAVVRLYVTHGKGQRLGSMVQSKKGSSLVYFGKDKSHLVAGVDIHGGIEIADVGQPGSSGVTHFTSICRWPSPGQLLGRINPTRCKYR